MGFVSNILGMTAQASEYDHAKRQTLIQGLAEKNKNYAQATETRRAAEASARMAGLSMMQMQGNKRREEGEARAAQALKGGTSEGSGNAMVEGVSKQHESAIANAALGESVNQHNALNEAIVHERRGDEAMRAAKAEAEQYRLAAQATRTGAWISAATGLAEAVAGGVTGAMGAMDFNAKQKEEAQGIIDGKIKPGDTQYLSTADALKLQSGQMGVNDLRTHSVTQEFFNFADAMGMAGSSAANMANPYLSKFTTPAWQQGLIDGYVYGNKNMKGTPYKHI